MDLKQKQAKKQPLRKKSVSLVEKKTELDKTDEKKPLTLIENEKNEKTKFQFGESPFAGLQFIESSKKERKDTPPYDSSPDPS